MMSKMPILKGILACIVTLGLLAGGMYYYGWQNNTPFIDVISKPYWITVTVIITIVVPCSILRYSSIYQMPFSPSMRHPCQLVL